MQLSVLVRDEYSHEWAGKSGQRKKWRLSVCDNDPTPGVVRCLNNLAYECTPEEEDKYKGKLKDRSIKITVQTMKPDFSGTIVCTGRIVEVVGPNGKGSESTK